MLKEKKRTAIIAAIIILPLLTCAFLIQTAPSTADKTFKAYLAQNGINTDNIEAPEKKYGAIRYKNLNLGYKNQTEITALTITFNPLKPLSKDIQTITIDEMFISGDIDINGNITLSSLPPFAIINDANIQNITVNEINFSILSAHFGGLRGVANISGSRKDGDMIWTGNIGSRQDQLELIAKINAQTNESGNWITDIEIENAKLERGFGKFTRVNGGVSYAGNGKNWQNLKADLIAGGFTAHGTSWQNAAITIEGTPQSTNAYIAAKSSGTDALELNIDAALSSKSIDWNARIHGNTGAHIINYFNAHNMLPLTNDALKNYTTIKNTYIQLKPNKNSLIFKVSNQSQKIDIKGKIEKLSSKNIMAKFTSNAPIDGANCRINGSSNRNLCTLNITHDRGKYTLKN